MWTGEAGGEGGSLRQVQRWGVGKSFIGAAEIQRQAQSADLVKIGKPQWPALGGPE